MRVLVIAPDKAGLDVARDLRASGFNGEVRALDGVVSRRECLKEISSGCNQIVHIAGHGSGVGVVVSDGLLEGNLLRQALAAGGVELVVLNFCASVTLAAAVHGQGAAKVISWRADPTDAQAGAWAEWFYAALWLSGDIWEAYRLSVETFEEIYPGVEYPIWLNGRLAALTAEVEKLKKPRPVMSVGLLGVVFVLLVVDGALSVSELWLTLGVPSVVAAFLQSFVLFAVLALVLGRLRVLR